MTREDQSPERRITRGRPYPLGVTPDETGVNVAVWAPEAEAVEFCLFPHPAPPQNPASQDPAPSRHFSSFSGQDSSVSADSAQKEAGEDGEAVPEVRFTLPYRSGEVWHAHIAAVAVGERYGLRADGPWDPDTGMLFNPHKLLVDPYATALDGVLRWDPLMTGHAVAPVPEAVQATDGDAHDAADGEAATEESAEGDASAATATADEAAEGESHGHDVTAEGNAHAEEAAKGAADEAEEGHGTAPGDARTGDTHPGAQDPPGSPVLEVRDTRDSSPVVPKAIVTPAGDGLGEPSNPRHTARNRPDDRDGEAGHDPAADQPTPNPAANRPGHDLAELVIYEAHVKGLSAAHPDVPPDIRGTYAGAAHPAIVDHLRRLGVNAVEFLPLQAFFDDRHLVEKGLTNYWGYQPLAWCAPEPRYATTPARADSELRHLVHILHAAGIEVILDVVYNHSGEGDALGPTLGPRGLNNRGYYRLDEEFGYINDTGTGNTLGAHRPGVLRLVLDSLRHWALRYGVDGFRFDLGATLGRGPHGFDPQAAFFQAAWQDPVLSGLKLIAEPWDIGPGGYRLGAFPHPFSEWNDTFRDGVRRLWRGESHGSTDFGSRFLASADVFDHGHRPAAASVNFVTAHDGFTLADVVSYDHKHNEANGEGGADGHGQNFSDNLGVEGPSDNPDVLLARRRRVRGMLATLLVSQGVPMLLAGDEMGNSQSGNNNAYAQDGEIGWVDWSGLGSDATDPELPDLVRRLVELRRRLPQLRQRAFLHGSERADGLPDVRWRRPDGDAPTGDDWAAQPAGALGAVVRGAADDPAGEALAGEVFVIVNPGPGVEFALSENPMNAEAAAGEVTDGQAAGGDSEADGHEPGHDGPADQRSDEWHLEIDTARPDAGGSASGTYAVLGQSVVVFSRG